MNENARRRKPVKGSSYIISREPNQFQSVTITVRIDDILDDENDPDPTYVMWVEVDCEQRDDQEGRAPNYWKAGWGRGFSNELPRYLEDYIKEHCPLADFVLSTARDMDLPEQLSGLFSSHPSGPGYPEPQPQEQSEPEVAEAPMTLKGIREITPDSDGIIEIKSRYGTKRISGIQLAEITKQALERNLAEGKDPLQPDNFNRLLLEEIAQVV